MMTIHKEQEKNTVAKLVIRINLQKYPPILLRINRLPRGVSSHSLTTLGIAAVVYISRLELLASLLTNFEFRAVLDRLPISAREPIVASYF